MGDYKIIYPNGDIDEIWVAVYQEIEDHIEYLGYEVCECVIEKVSY